MPKNVILIVDDDPKSRKLLNTILKVEGYTTIEAINGKQGFELAKAQKPSLILMDIMMPVMDGLTALSLLRNDKATSAIPVTMLTSVGHELNRILSIDLGAVEYITKPVDRIELLNTIRRLMVSA
jgi:DNA-binding response OmpR family regulator